MNRAEVERLGLRIAEDARSMGKPPLVILADVDEDGLVPCLQLYDSATGNYIGRVYSERHYVELLREAWCLAAALN